MRGYVDPSLWFAENFAGADAKFQEAAGAYLAESHRHPLAGPDGEALHVRVARIGPDRARRVMFLLAGTHGTELCAGSGVMVGLLCEPGRLRLPPDTAVVMIHAINPWGAAWRRYVNEDNADLMKNFLYGDRPAPPDPLFAAIDAALDIPSLGTAEGIAEMDARRTLLEAAHGPARIVAALKAGQATHPNSIVYYGRESSWSKRRLDEIVARHGAGAEQVLFVDLHTGMGVWGGCMTVAEGSETSKRRVRAWTLGRAEATDLVVGKPLYGFVEQLVPGCELTVCYLEGGTETWGWEMRRVMLREMFFHLHGDRHSEEAHAVKARFARFYDPGTEAWARRYWASTAAVLGRLLDGFAGG